ncbi:MAG: peptidoglycan DD-metalloendopeptidase family protein [Anaerolineae bacterium]
MRRKRTPRFCQIVALSPLGLALALLYLLTAAVAAQEPTPAPTVYVVQPGDTLFRIAQTFDTTVEALVAANDIADPSLIRVGQKLIIPFAPPAPVRPVEETSLSRIHPMRPGETLPFLAFRYGTTVWVLRLVNDLDPLEVPRPGQLLKIPPPIVDHPGVPQLPTIATKPASGVQGQTLLIEVRGERKLDLQGSLLDQELWFVEEKGRSWALLGIGALTRPGRYSLTIQATEVESGDRLTMQETITVTRGNFTTYNIVVPADRQNLLDPTLIRTEQARVNAVFAQVSPTRQWNGLFGYPLAGELVISSPFGQRRSYNGGPVSSYHAGHDYKVDEGTPVFAPMTGTVALAEPLQVRGLAVILDHGLGVMSAYWHLSQIDVQIGQVVGKGQVIGLAGDTGLSTGPHLHWEMRVFGVPVDPVQWTQQEFP